MSCPIKSSKEFKLLQEQLGNEESAIYTWKALGESYPSTLKSTSSLKQELGVKGKMSNDQIVALAQEVKRYNKFNGTSHSFSYKQFAETTDYTVNFNVSYLPVRKEISRLELFEQNPTWMNTVVDIRTASNLQGLPEVGDDFFMGDQALREQDEKEQITLPKRVIENEMKDSYWEELYVNPYLKNNEDFTSVPIPTIKNKFQPDFHYVYHGTNTYKIDENGDLILTPSLNFEGKTQSVSLTQIPVVAQDYMLRKGGDTIVRISNDALPANYDIESAEEIAINTDKPVIIKKGDYQIIKVSSIREVMKEKYDREIAMLVSKMRQTNTSDLDILYNYYSAAADSDNQSEFDEYEGAFEERAAPDWYVTDGQLRTRAAKILYDSVKDKITKQWIIDNMAQRLIEGIENTGQPIENVANYLAINFDYGSRHSPHGGTLFHTLMFRIGLSDYLINKEQYKEYQEIVATITTKVKEKEEQAIAFYNSSEGAIARKAWSDKMFGTDDLAFYRSEPSLMDILLHENPQNNLSSRVTDNSRAREIAAKLSEQLGIDFSMVTPEEAKELTKNAKNPWNGEPAFFIGGKVYFVGESLTTNIALHEFSHPLVRAVAKDNKALFDNLYKGLKETAEGRELIQEVIRLYPELNETDPLFKEEVIVRAIEKQGASQFKTSTGFAKIINDILYAIKQMLRRMFGQKADVSKLNSNTTLEQLTTMLVSGQKFVINTEVVSDEDVIAYARQQTADINDTLRIKNTDVQDFINQVFSTANKHIKNLQNNRELDELAKILVDDFKASDLAEMSGNLSKYQTVINNKADRFREDMEYQTKQATALVNTLYRLDNMTEKIVAHMEDIIQNPNADNHNLGRVHYYDVLLTQWLDVVEKGKVILNDPKNKVSSKSPLMQVIKSIETSIERSKSLINDIKAEGARDTLFNELEPMGRDIKTRYDGIIEGLKKRKAPQKEIDKWHKEFYGLTEAEYETLKRLEVTSIRTPEQESEYKKLKNENAQGLEISKAKIESLLKGQAGDANYFNSYLEGYLYNTDPIIGGLALYVKNKMTEVMAITQAKNNDFATDMKPLLEKAGFSGHRIGELGKRIGELDTVGRVNEKGELEERQVWSLKSKFKGYRYAVDKLNHDVTVAQTAWSNSGSDTDRANLVRAISVRKKHMRKWFHQQYSDAYYERENLFESDDIGAEAAYRRDNLLEDIKLMGASAQTPGQQLDITEALDKLWSDYRQLHSLYNIDGSKKEGTELEIANRLIQYRDASREFHDFEERPGVFQNALSAYEQEIINDGNPIGSATFNSLRKTWLDANTRIRIKNSFYERRQEIFEELKELFSSLPDKEALDMTLEWEQIIEKSAGFRDEDGQLKANEMSPSTISDIKALQEAIIKKKKDQRDKNKLSPSKKLRFNELQALKDEKLISPEETAELTALYKSIQVSNLSEGQKLRLETLYAELEELSRTEPTEYYVHTLNDWLQQLNTDKIETKLNSRIISLGTASEILDKEILADLFKQSPEFETWFKKNHLEREVFNPDTKQMEMKWERLYVWNIVKPNDPQYMETTKILTAEGKPDVVEGLPTNKYYKRVVKAQDDNGRPIETKQIVGVTVDNRGDWLPKDIANSPYLNESYTQLNAADKAVLDKMTEHHLRNQEGLDRKSKLYLDFPRFRKSSLEALQTSNVAKEKWNGLTLWAKRARNFWTGAKDDAQSGMNEKENFNLVKVDVFDNELTGVPVAGLYDIDPIDVSTDITTNLMRYMFSVERQKQLIKISPFARAVQSVVKDSRNEVLLDAQLKTNFVTRTIQVFKGKKSVSIREKAVNNFLERELEGQNITGYTKDIPWINNLQSTLNARASFGFFALNIPSALKNAFGAKFQGMIEASAGTNMNQLTFAQAEGTSLKTMMEISGQVYAKGPKSLNVQLVELMDPAQGRFEDKIGESLSRTISKDTASMTWLYNFRKWTELQATLQIFFGMMHHKRINQKQADGTIKKIDYANAWEIKNGKIQLKDGIDPTWGITYNTKGEIQVGAEYTKMRNRVHQVMNNLQGAYSKFDQPEAQRYLMFRFVSFLRRYFTTMFMNRWGFSGKWNKPRPRLNPGMGDVQMGYYITFLKTLKTTFTELGRNLPHMPKEERGAALKVITEIGALMIASALMGLLFGWNPDDEDRFEKLRAKSGALPFPLSPDDPSRPFDGFGFLENHALYLLMNIRAENEQLVPFSGFGLDDYSQMLGMQSIAFKPTIQNYIGIIDDMVNIIQGDEKAYYQREVGPYNWQKEGSAKIWSRLATIVGLSGSSLDPAKAVTGFQSSQALKR